MNDLHWIKYEPKRMYLDTTGMSSTGERAHRRLCDYIWWNGDAPTNLKKPLCDISQTDPALWNKVRRELIKKGWIDGPTAFFHRAVVASLNESNKSYVSNMNRTIAAHNFKFPAEKRPLLELCSPDAETGVIHYREQVVTRLVTTPVTKVVKPPATRGQSQSQPQSEQLGKNKSLSSKLSVGGPGGKRDVSSHQADEEVPMTVGHLTSVATHILSNVDGWDYDTSRVKVKDFTSGGLKTVLLPFLGHVTIGQAHAAFKSAAAQTHAAAVDGLIKTTVGAYCTDVFRYKLGEAMNPP